MNYLLALPALEVEGLKYMSVFLKNDLSSSTLTDVSFEVQHGHLDDLDGKDMSEICVKSDGDACLSWLIFNRPEQGV